MKLLDIDWAQFFRALPSYRGLPLEARRFFIEHVKPSQAVPNAQAGPWRDVLLGSGLVAPGFTGVNFNVKPEYREFSRAIRAMSRSHVFTSPSRDTFQLYMDDHLNTEEIATLADSRYYSRMDYRALQQLFSSVTSASWLRRFLEAKTRQWEIGLDVMAGTQALVRSFIQREGPVAMSRIPELCAGVHPSALSAAVRAAFRHLLLFTALRPDDLEPIAGCWPGTAERLSGKAHPPPVAVEVSEVFQAPFLMDDMVAILSASVVEPIRLRSGDRNIFETSRTTLAASLGTLPQWVEAPFRLSPDHRITTALDFLAEFDYIKEFGRPGMSFGLKSTDEGAGWLALQPKERMRALMDGLHGRTKSESSLYGEELMQLVPGLDGLGARGKTSQYADAVLQAWGSAPLRADVRVSDFLLFHSQSGNPLATAAVRKDPYFTLSINGRYLTAPTDEEIEAAWQRILYMFFHLRLLPLGGVKVGLEAGGKDLCFRLTDIGACLLGKAKDFDMAPDAGAHILVQPNFDVVFLAPSARVESEIGRFAERKGRHVGTLFRITRSSILAAAAAGVTVDRVLAILREYCQAGIPKNVETEIIGWFGRYRQIEVRPAVLIHCPDEETSVRALAALGKSASRISATLLEFHREKIPPAVAKKLREAGVFIRTREIF